MAIKKVINREIAVLKLPRQIPQLISKSKGVVLSMTSNANFPVPFPGNIPVLATVTADINALDAAELVALTGVNGAVEARDIKKEVVLKDMRLYNAYVQGVADNNPSNAAQIIKSAGMGIKQRGTYTRPDFSVNYGNVSGTVSLVVKAVGKRASYEWQMSTDAKTWLNLPNTLTCKTLVDGLTPGTTYYFRYNTVTKDGEGTWSQVVTILAI
jgi:hypothetical protein